MQGGRRVSRCATAAPKDPAQTSTPGGSFWRSSASGDSADRRWWRHMVFVHIADAADATAAAVEHGSRGVYNIVDDDPAPVAEWMPKLTHMLSGKKPRRMPGFILRLFTGEGGVVMRLTPRCVECQGQPRLT